MRSGLLSDLTAVGYEIFLEGDQVKLRYRKPDDPPDTARRLIDELRKYKTEVENILRTGDTVSPPYKSQPRVAMKTTWSPEVESLVEWFMLQEAPSQPFHLQPHLRVVDPCKFFSSLRQDIAKGPAGARAKFGTLQDDLRKLKIYLN